MASFSSWLIEHSLIIDVNNDEKFYRLIAFELIWKLMPDIDGICKYLIPQNRPLLPFIERPHSWLFPPIIGATPLIFISSMPSGTQTLPFIGGNTTYL